MNRVAMENAPVQQVACIRAAGPQDLQAVAPLISRREGVQRNLELVRRIALGLDPQHCVAWLAFAGERPVGLSMAFLRTLVWQGESHRVAYWANLYIDPEFRNQMLYPRLPLAMFADVLKRGVEFVYASVRLRDLAVAHTRLGFAKLGEIGVLLKPLRPARLVAKHKNLGRAVMIAGAPLDAAFGAYLALRRPPDLVGCSLEEVELDSPHVETIVNLLHNSSGQRVHQSWTADVFRQRYEQSRDSERYSVLAVFGGQTLRAAVIYGLAHSGNDIAVGVIMDLLWTAGSEDAARMALAQAQHRCRREGADAMLCLDGVGDAGQALVSGMGYRRTSETYDLLVYPKKAVSNVFIAYASNWRFAFGDHDAF